MQLDLPLGLGVGGGGGNHTPPDASNHNHKGVHGNGGNVVEYKALGTLETMHEVSIFDWAILI